MPVLNSLAMLKLISREEVLSHKNYFSLGRLRGILDASGLKKMDAKHYNLFMNLLFVYEK
jgi:hypothetical protein